MAEYGGNKQQTLRADFFYKNVFQREGEAKAKALQIGVRNNLTPFRDLLNNLLLNNDKLMRVSATVYPVDSVITLEPEFSLVKLALGKDTKYAIPADKYYILEWDEGYGDFEDFIEIIDRRRNFVLTKNEKVDFFEGYVIFKSNDIFQGSLNLWYGKDEVTARSATCELHEIHFERDFGKYRISASKPVGDIRFDGESISIRNTDDA